MSGHSTAHHATCQNCGAPLGGPYCSACGQHDVDYHRSIWPMLEDALEGFFHFDGKAVKSVRYLLTRPGFLTQEFVAGRRASYANPLRLYIFVSFLFFAASALLSHRMTREEEAQLETDLSDSRHEVANALKSSPELQQTIEAAYARRAATAAAPTPSPTPASGLLPLKVTVGSVPPLDGEAIKIRVLDDPNNKSAISRYLREHLGPNGKVSVRAVEDEVAHLLPAMLFLCLPILALILTVAYKGTHRFYIEHFVFALHLQTLLFLAGIVAKIAAKLVNLASHEVAADLQLVVFLIAGWLVYRAFRRFYGQGRMKTALKLGLVTGSYLVILIIGMVVISIGSVMVVVREA